MMRFYFSLFFIIAVFFAEHGQAAEVFETFLEPNQVVDIASSSRGRLAMLHVKEGDKVKKGSLLAELDSTVLQARLDLARKTVDFHGQLDSARALVKQRKSKLKILTRLNKSGNARQQEIDSAETNLLMAEAQLLTAKEEQNVKKAELAIILAQIEERKLRSPLDGEVIAIYKQEAELVGVNEQQAILTLVELDPLLAVFHLPLSQTSVIQTSESVALSVAGKSVAAQLDFISPVIEAQSGTITVRFRLPNPNAEFISGSRVTYTPQSSQGVVE